jgi:hypothetical protein
MSIKHTGMGTTTVHRALGGMLLFSCLAAGAQQLQFDTQLTSLSLGGGPFLMPLASDPGNALGDSVEGYGFVMSSVAITLSSQRAVSPGPASLGQAFAFPDDLAGATLRPSPRGDGNPGNGLPPIDPGALDGKTFRVNSFFDVFFDITVTDVDSRPGRDFAGMPDGMSIGLPDNGPAHMQSVYTRVFDKDAPNFGLVPPPEVSPYIGHFNIEIPLGGDLNGNGENDKIKFTLAAHSVGDEDRTFIVLPDGTVIDNFLSAAYLEGFIVDESTDPPFSIGLLDPGTGLPDPGSFGGPTTASSVLLNPVVGSQVPEPSTWAGGALLCAGAFGVWRRGRRGAAGR